jgi:hypothetical protein
MLRLAIILLGIFFDLATIVLVCVGVALVWPGTVMDSIWLLKPEREFMLMPYRLWLGPLLLVFAVPAAAASYGLLTRQEWARQLAAVIFTANALGNIAQIAIGHTIEGAIGVIAATILVYLLTRDAVRRQFVSQPIADSL